jgi:hypothetical protein
MMARRYKAFEINRVRLLPGKSWKPVMKAIILILLMFSGYSYANCENIKDDDQRNYCRAQESGSGCDNIKNDDMRNACKGETTGSGCQNIHDNDQRNLCEAKQSGHGCENIKNDDMRNQCKTVTQ